MTLQTWCFSWHGRIGRRDLWVWLVLWLLLLILLFTLTRHGWLSTKSAALCLICLQWPTGAVVVKRLHDRNKSGWWGLLLVLAWVLMAGNWDLISPEWHRVMGRFFPLLILVTMTVELGFLPGSQGENRFGLAANPVIYRRRPNYQ